LHDANGADRMLAKSIELYPGTSAGYELWADVKREKGDTAAAERYHRRALENSDLFENYAEVAALWFKLSWRDDESLIRNQLNPMMLQISKSLRRGESFTAFCNASRDGRLVGLP